MAVLHFARLTFDGFRWGAAALAVAAATLAPLAARADDVDSGQAEWRQNYETSERISVGRETTPVLSAATVAATEAAIQTYQGIVARGGWNTVPNSADLKIGSKSKAVQALRERLIASGDLDSVAGMGPTFEFVRRSGGEALPVASWA